jgi:hypothetical protein
LIPKLFVKYFKWTMPWWTMNSTGYTHSGMCVCVWERKKGMQGLRIWWWMSTELWGQTWGWPSCPAFWNEQFWTQRRDKKGPG